MRSLLALFANRGRFDFRTFFFRQNFWKANTYCVYISGRANWRLFKFANELASRYMVPYRVHGQFTSRCRSTHDIWYPTRFLAANKIQPEHGIKVWSKPEFDVCFDWSLYKRPAMADPNQTLSKRIRYMKSITCYKGRWNVEMNLKFKWCFGIGFFHMYFSFMRTAKALARLLNWNRFSRRLPTQMN